MAEIIRPEALPFNEAIDALLRKVNIPSESWTEIWQEMHARAFTVAGAMRDDLVADFRKAVEKGITSGTTLGDFRKDFDQIVDRYGWEFKGGRNWRSATIFDTNMRVLNSAGRYKQQADPDVLAARPYFIYSAVKDTRTRKQHRDWDGLVLPANDPWWDTHYPPNGWGCRCRVRNASQRDLDRLGLKVQTAPQQGTYEWADPRSGEVREVPVGIDPGWAYHPGKAALAAA